MEKKNGKTIKTNIKILSRKLFNFNGRKIRNVLNSMLVDKSNIDDCFLKINSENEIYNFDLMLSFLNEYMGTDIIQEFNDIFLQFDSPNFSKEFYIYFFEMFYCRSNCNASFRLKNNINDLFYGLEVEALFNKDKFRCHYKKHYLDDMTLERELNDSLITNIKGLLPKQINTQLELAIALYILLCQYVSYSTDYIINHDITNVSKYYDVNSETNDVICVTFAIIYYKLLKIFGIEANLSGDLLTHMKVELRINSMMLVADGTSFGFEDMSSKEYKISDIGNTKFDFCLKGFYLADDYYVDIPYISYNQKKLEEAFFQVNRMLGIDNSIAIKLGNILYEYSLKLRECKKSNEITFGEEIDYRIQVLNKIYSFKLDGSECENKQFLAKFKHKIFEGISLKDILLYSVDEKIKLFNLYVITCPDEEVYYLDDGVSFKKYSKEEVINEIDKRRLRFKNENDAIVLLEDNRRLQKI